MRPKRESGTRIKNGNRSGKAELRKRSNGNGKTKLARGEKRVLPNENLKKLPDEAYGDMQIGEEHRRT